MNTYTTKLYITSSNLDIEKINAILFNSLEFGGVFDKEAFESSNAQYKSKINQGLILIPQFEKKDKFKEILSSLYQNYPSKTYLFLGDINSYSTQLQEGLLKLIEEPPANLQIIIYSRNSNNILGTIKSRSAISTISDEIIAFCLDQNLLESVKDKFPSPLEFSKKYISNTPSTIKSQEFDLKKVERDEINMWLWQVLFCLKKIYKSNSGSRIIARRIANIIKVMDLNEKNLQKKVAFEYLFCE